MHLLLHYRLNIHKQQTDRDQQLTCSYSNHCFQDDKLAESTFLHHAFKSLNGQRNIDFIVAFKKDPPRSLIRVPNRQTVSDWMEINQKSERLL